MVANLDWATKMTVSVSISAETSQCWSPRMNADKRIQELDGPAAPEFDPRPEYIELAAEVMSILSDPTRFRIIFALRQAGELGVGELAENVGKRPSGVSQHLARLRMARMVTTRQEGTRVLYRLAGEHALVLVTEAVKQAEHSVAHGQVPPHHHAPEED